MAIWIEIESVIGVVVVILNGIGSLERVKLWANQKTLTSGVTSVPVLTDDKLELNSTSVDVAALELLDGALGVLLAIVADDALVPADVAVGGTVADLASLAHEVFEILPAKNSVISLKTSLNNKTLFSHPLSLVSVTFGLKITSITHFLDRSHSKNDSEKSRLIFRQFIELFYVARFEGKQPSYKGVILGLNVLGEVIEERHEDL